MKDLLFTVDDTIKNYNMIKMNDGIVIGVSGGPDSMCLLHILIRLKEKYNLSIFATHLNHQFRGKEADKDAAYVEDICRKWGIPVYVKKIDVAAYAKKVGVSDEEAGRIIRYNHYEEILNVEKANKIAVAHNLNDHIETIFINMIRGSGIEGLKGIEAVRDNIIRPIIAVERKDIEKYCIDNEIDYRVDKTNLEPIYGRNKIRIELIPYIEENLNPNIIATLNRLSNIASIENDYIDIQTKKAFAKMAICFKNSVKYSIIRLNDLHPAIIRRVIRMGLEKLLGSLKGIEYKHIEEIISLTKLKTGATVMLPGNITAYISYENLIIKNNIDKEPESFCYKLQQDKDNTIEPLNIIVSISRLKISEIGSLNKNPNEIYIDRDRIIGDLVIRNRVPGDTFSPIGLKGKKKLKDFFIDEKIPKEERGNILILADNVEIIWVVDRRISEKYKITDNTKDVIGIKVLRRTTNDE